MLRARAGKVAAVLATAGLALGGVLAVGVPSGSAQAAPMGCTTGFFYASGAEQTIWKRTAAGTDVLAATAPVRVTALAQDPVSGNLYAFTTAAGLTNHLFRAEADGSVTDLGAVAGISGSIGNAFSAAFDHTGKLWAEYTQNGGQLTSIDVATMSATSRPISGNVTNDMAELDGTMYSSRSGILARIDLSTGTVTTVPVAGFTFPVGSAMWAMDGHLYVNIGSTGIGEVLNPASATPTLSLLATGLAAAAGDGTSCEPAGNPFLNAEADDLTATTVFAGVGGDAGNVFTNDLLNGASFAPADVTTTVVDDGGLTGVALDADGTLAVPAGAAAGGYAVAYRICQTAAGRTTVCDTATATVRVAALPVVDAVDDDFTAAPITAGTVGTAGNVFVDDTVDGAAVTASAVTATITDDGGLSGAALTASGDLTVPATAAPGTYAVTYQLCAVSAPTACDTATASVRVVPVLPVVDAVDDDFTAAPITAGTAGTAGNVFVDDTVDGAAVTASAVTATITDDGGLGGAALTASGDLTVPATAVPGTYAVTYQLCAVSAPTACDSAAASVRVIPAGESVPPPGGGTPGDPDAGGAGPSDTPDAPHASGGSLASTGSDLATTLPAGAIAVVLSLLGGALLLLGRRRAAD